MTENMWKFSHPIDAVTPLSIMKGQGDQLWNLTNGLLLARINSAGNGDHIINSFAIVVPNIGNYSFTLIQYLQQAQRIFPGEISCPLLNTQKEINSIDAFKSEFRFCLQSPPVVELVESLMAQARDAG